MKMNTWFRMKSVMQLFLVGLSLLCIPTGMASAGERWTEEQANEWYAKQPWLVGCDFLPSTAINQLEMWQADTFDPDTIDRELGWAASIGFNSVRVYLHDLLWKEDRDGYFKRIDAFLSIADKHNITTLMVIFDGVWDPNPKPGKQRKPTPGVHNSGWVQSPGRELLADAKKQDELKPYVTDLLRQFGNDKRIVIWDLFNEPDNTNTSSYGKQELSNKDEVAAQLTRKAFAWSREVNPSQPLTVGLWYGRDWDQAETLNLVHQAALELSDIISFHEYNSPDSMRKRIAQLRKYGRPLVCTEYMARGNGSTFESVLPILKQEKVGAYNWGLVDGKSQTKQPWSTWETPILGDPEPWHHDIFRADGTPYSEEEVALIREVTGVEF